jgi:hypothetical protein
MLTMKTFFSPFTRCFIFILYIATTTASSGASQLDMYIYITPIILVIATRGAGTAYPSLTPEFTPAVNEVRVTRSLVFCAMFGRSSFVLFLLSIVLSVLRFTDYDCPSSIFKLFLYGSNFDSLKVSAESVGWEGSE